MWEDWSELGVTESDGTDLWLQVDGVATGGFPTSTALGIGAVVAFVVVAIVVGMVAALTAEDSRRDLRLIGAVGANPGFRRRFLGLQTALQVLLGAIIAIPIGLLFRHLTVSTGELHASLFATVDTGALGWPSRG